MKIIVLEKKKLEKLSTITINLKLFNTIKNKNSFFYTRHLLHNLENMIKKK